MKIALYGGSFNPPHLQHQAVVRHLAERFDEVWVIPCKEHALGKDLLPYDVRLGLCLTMVWGLQKTLTKVMPRHQAVGLSRKTYVLKADEIYTVDLVERLKTQHPFDTFVVVVGSDILHEAHRWHRWDDLNRLAEIYVLGREGHEVEGREFEAQFENMSSTEFRKLMADGKLDEARAMVPDRVWMAVQRFKLYGHP